MYIGGYNKELMAIVLTVLFELTPESESESDGIEVGDKSVGNPSNEAITIVFIENADNRLGAR